MHGRSSENGYRGIARSGRLAHRLVLHGPALEIPRKDLLALQVLDLSSPPATTRRGLHAERPDQRQADGATDMRLPFARPAGRNLRVHAGKPGIPGSRDAPRSHVHECRVKHGARAGTSFPTRNWNNLPSTITVPRKRWSRPSKHKGMNPCGKTGTLGCSLQ